MLWAFALINRSINKSITSCNILGPGFGHLAWYLNLQLVKVLHPFSSPNTLSLSPSSTHRLSNILLCIGEPRQIGPFQIGLVLKLFDVSNNRISTKILRKAQKPYVHPIRCDEFSLSNGPHYALSLGLLRL